jgi:hypothetical protein
MADTEKKVSVVMDHLVHLNVFLSDRPPSVAAAAAHANRAKIAVGTISVALLALKRLHDAELQQVYHSSHQTFICLISFCEDAMHCMVTCCYHAALSAWHLIRYCT